MNHSDIAFYETRKRMRNAFVVYLLLFVVFFFGVFSLDPKSTVTVLFVTAWSFALLLCSILIFVRTFQTARFTINSYILWFWICFVINMIVPFTFLVFAGIVYWGAPVEGRVQPSNLQYEGT